MLHTRGTKRTPLHFSKWTLGSFQVHYTFSMMPWALVTLVARPQSRVCHGFAQLKEFLEPRVCRAEEQLPQVSDDPKAQRTRQNGEERGNRRGVVNS